MLEFITVYIKTYDLHLNITEELQYEILDIYQELYDAEVYLTTKNIREQRSPVEFIPNIRATKAKRPSITIRKNKGVKRLKVNKTLKRKPLNKNTNRKTQMLLQGQENPGLYIPRDQVMITP